jgi:hypothetical protein
MSLQSLQPQSSELSKEISIYKGDLTQRTVVQNIAIIKKSFPALPIGFYDVFIDRIKANGFNDARLNDAVTHVIDNCVYPTPTIAQFISFDRKIKTYTYSEYCKFCDEGLGNLYEPVVLQGRSKPVWIHVNDIEQYKLNEQ